MAAKGKWSEAKVRDWLRQHKGERKEFTFNRVQDAGASRGALQNPVTGDFQWFLDGRQVVDVAVAGDLVERPYTRNGVIEVKEVTLPKTWKGGTFRLPYQNASVDAVGRMRIRAMAGSEALFLVCFRDPNDNKGNYWCSPTLEMIEQRDPAKPNGSWDLSELLMYTHCDDILKEYLA